MAVIDPDKVSDILRETAALHIMPRYKALEDHEISSKSSPQDLVTQADIEAEAHLERILPDLLRGSIVIGEESVSREEASLKPLHDKEAKIWIVDPVDGTHNFVHHKPEFGVMLACIISGQAEYAWIYDPLSDAMTVAERGSGAYQEGVRLTCEDRDDPSEMHAHYNPRFFSKKIRPSLEESAAAYASCGSLRCAAHEYLRLAKGQAHILLYSKLKPWDHVPGCLIVEEAGGLATLWDKRPYQPEAYDTGLLVASGKKAKSVAYDTFVKNLL